MTKHLHFLTSISLVAILLFSQSSCRKEKTTWDTNLKAPIATTELKIANLLSSDLIQTEADSSLKLVFENVLSNITVTDVFEMPDTTVDFGSSLQSLELPDDSTTQSITLGEIATAAGQGALIAFLEGTMFALPAMSNIPVNPIAIDNSALFESVDVKTGTLEITITNGLQVDITGLVIDLKNSPTTGNDLIATTTFPLIAANTSVTNSIPLDGKVVSSQLIADLVSFSTSASAGPVLIKGADAIVTKVVIKDVVPNSATAIWPNQDLIDSTSLVIMEQDNGVMIKEMIVKEGNIDIEVFSSLQDSMFITYTVPNLTKGGQVFVATTALGPAAPGGIVSTTETFSFDGYEFKFNGFGIESTYGQDLNNNALTDADTVNAYVQNMKVRMQHTGVMKTLSETDTVYIKAKVTNVVPEYIEGYMGKDTINIGPSSIAFDMFSQHLSGQLKIEDAKMDIVIDNGIGAAAKLEIQSISGTSAANSTTVNLTGSGISGTHALAAGTKSGNPSLPVAETKTTVQLNSTNSNATDFIGNLPSSLSYTLKTILNPDLPVPTYNDVINNPPNFLYDGYGFNSKVSVEVPLSVVADNLMLVDTIDFTYTGESSGMTNATFTLVVENGFGFDATINLVLMSATGVESDTLMSNGFIARSVVNPTSGKTTSATKSLIHFAVDQAMLTSIKNSSKIKAIIKLHSYGINDSSQKFHKMYSSDSFKLKLIGSAVYNVNF